jgi:rubrerythrin
MSAPDVDPPERPSLLQVPGPGEGGDAVCWLDRVCDRCGTLEDGPPARVCPRCGSGADEAT